MKKLSKGQILVTRSTVPNVCVTFYEVLKSTTNTCELRELRKDIVNQTHDEQEVLPELGSYISNPFRRKVLPTGCVKIQESLYAWPWDGTSEWQAVLIYIP